MVTNNQNYSKAHESGLSQVSQNVGKGGLKKAGPFRLKEAGGCDLVWIPQPSQVRRCDSDPSGQVEEVKFEKRSGRAVAKRYKEDALITKSYEYNAVSTQYLM